MKHSHCFFSRIVLIILLSLILLTCARMKPPEKPAPVGVEIEDVFARRIVSLNDLPAGKWAQGYIDDLLLGNSKISLIIGTLDSQRWRENEAGSIVDIIDPSTGIDYFGRISPFQTGMTARYIYEKSFEVRNVQFEERGETYPAVSVVFTGRDFATPMLKIMNEYILGPQRPYLIMRTTLSNTSDEEIKDVVLGDNVIWGAQTTFVGRHGSLPPIGSLETRGEWVCGFIDDFSVGIVNPQSAFTLHQLKNMSLITYRKVTLDPGESVSYDRYIMVAGKNIADLSNFNVELRGGNYGIVKGKASEVKTGTPVRDVEVTIFTHKMRTRTFNPRPYTRAYTDENGEYEIKLQPGDYFMRSKAFGRKTQSSRFALTAFDTPNQKPRELPIQVQPPVEFYFRITDADSGLLLPCKISFENLSKSSVGVDFGSHHRARGARNIYYSPTGEGKFVVERGHYRVTVSKGIEYATFSQEMKIDYSGMNLIETSLKRNVDTPGYISADLSVKTSNSHDCAVSPEDRVISAVGEGVEFLLTDDVNTVTDLNPVIAQLGLSPFVSAGSGAQIEIPLKKNIGSFSIFPLDPAQSTLDPEILNVQNVPDLFSRIRKTYPETLIQVNDPLGDTGFFTLHKYNYISGLFDDKDDFSYDFDVMQIWRGKHQKQVENSLKAFYRLNFRGKKTILTSGSNSRWTYSEEVGYPRIYFGCDKEDVSSVTSEDLVKALKEGNIIITNSFFLDLKVNDARPGDLVQAKDGKVHLDLKVLAPVWLEGVTTLKVFVNNKWERHIILPPSKNVLRYGKLPSDKKGIDAEIEQDSTVHVSVRGHGKMQPVATPYYGMGPEPVVPFACTFPVFVDADGDGKYTPPSEL